MYYVFLCYLISPIIYVFIFFKKKNGVRKILIIQTAKIGDLICSTPLFREIKKKYPKSCLNVIINPITRELLEHNPYIDQIITIHQNQYKGFLGKFRLAQIIRKGNYDVAISLNPNIPFTIALFWGLVPIRLTIRPIYSGLTFRLALIFTTYFEKHTPDRLVIETYLKLLDKININSANLSKEVYKSKGADRVAMKILKEINQPVIGIAVTSGKKLKELGPKKVSGIINFILDKMDVCIVLVGSVQDTDIAKVVKSLTKRKENIIDATGKLNLKELPALIEKLSLFIGVDTGIIYMADALSIPVIDIAGPSNMNDQRPIGANAIIIKKKLPCAPCSYIFKAPSFCRTGTKECVKSVTVEDVFEVVNILFRKHGKTVFKN